MPPFVAFSSVGDIPPHPPPIAPPTQLRGRMQSPAAITYGPIFIGVALNIVLYGIMITQTFLYFTVYKRDKIWLKLYVVLLFVCDTLNSVFDLAFLYIPLVNNFGNESSLQYASWVFATDPAMTAIIALLVQLFFAWRVKVLTNNIPVVVFITLCSLAQWSLGTVSVEFEVLSNLLMLGISKRKHRTGFSATDDVLNKIIRLTVQTGLVTAICAIIDLIAFLATPSGLHLIFNLPLSKLYTNSLMSSLNSRAGWKYGTSAAKSGDSRSGVQSSLNPTTTHHVGSQQVFIDVESHELVDVEKKSPVATTPSTENVYAVQGRPFGEKRASVTINVPPAVRHA
ncbi:hypothetical protein NLI96_g2272 [Meripilus lineatus]|uniref:DUF6534 domain-containing protein n=1 Tax=Meripilus lineatus TaxID=2056292 RepID=A0AAD5YHM0_9APHY|nr:hypothetical protein NLI96_g2272 [Physisporinus lineatus]